MVHLTYRTYGSIPRAELRAAGDRYEREAHALYRRFPVTDRAPAAARYPAFREALRSVARAYHRRCDRWLSDHPRAGFQLAQAAAKRIVIDSWRGLAAEHDLTLYAITVLSNQVHLLFRANEATNGPDLARLLAWHRADTTHRLNLLDGVGDRRIWARYPFATAIPTGSFRRVLRYVLERPADLGLTDHPLQFPGAWWDPRLDESYLPTPRRAA